MSIQFRGPFLKTPDDLLGPKTILGAQYSRIATVKLVLNGHPQGMAKWPLNTGWPPNTGSRKFHVMHIKNSMLVLIWSCNVQFHHNKHSHGYIWNRNSNEMKSQEKGEQRELKMYCLVQVYCIHMVFIRPLAKYFRQTEWSNSVITTACLVM